MGWGQKANGVRRIRVIPMLVSPARVLSVGDCDKCAETHLSLLDLDGSILALFVLADSSSIWGYLCDKHELVIDVDAANHTNHKGLEA